MASQVVDIPATLGARADATPYIHKILIENLLRNARLHPDAGEAAERWVGRGERDVDIPFRPGRILMHDTTCGPALVDLAALRSVVAAAGGSPEAIAPCLRVDVSTDHSIATDHYGAPDAMERNMAEEMRRNRERFVFAKWASVAMNGLFVHPPGTGIMHTLNLERLATVVSEGEWAGEHWAFPDTLIGTDSHSPMINGIGVLGWGVGGLEAESVMVGMPLMVPVPEIVGVRLIGALSEGITSTDLALAVTSRLRKASLDGRFVEFFGAGVSTLTAGTRATVANMAPEYGGTTGIFAIDAATIAYLEETGRDASHCARVESYARRQGLWFDPHAQPDYAECIEIDLSAIGRGVAGPRRPQDHLPLERASAALTSSSPSKGAIPTRAVALAAITSCTNTSDPRSLIAAGLVARRARAHGLTPPEWVKTTLSPGSPTARAMLERVGLLADLESLGFAIAGVGCMACIGNSGRLTDTVEAAVQSGKIDPVAVLSGNRNFPGRVHAMIQDAFLASPAMVVAYALAGDFGIDITRMALGRSADGTAVSLCDLLPENDEVDAMLKAALRPADVDAAYGTAERNSAWLTLEAPTGPLYPWNPQSTYLRPPPFASATLVARLGTYDAFPLLVLGDDISTDQISPAGSIPPESEAAAWLVAKGEDARDLNVFSARRGNWEVMLRGMFTNRSVRNALDNSLCPGETIHAPSGERIPLWQAAGRYAATSHSVVILAGHRYGMGSSRDWAAKGQYLLGVRAVLARSFEPIHRSNLINMGILPLVLPQDIVPDRLGLRPSDKIRIEAEAEQITQHTGVPVRISYADGTRIEFVAKAAIVTLSEVETLREGGMLPRIARSALNAPPSPSASVPETGGA